MNDHFLSSQENFLPCHEKIAFQTRRDAQAAATVARHRYGGKFKVYQCQYCYKWHLSSD